MSNIYNLNSEEIMPTSFNILFESIDDAALIFDINEDLFPKKCLNANKIAIDLFGKDIVNGHADQFFNKLKVNTVNNLDQLFREFINRDKIKFNAYLKTDKGSSKNVEITVKIVLLGGEKKMLIFIKNADYREKILQELEYEKKFFNTFMENVPASVYFKDKESRFKKTNKTTVKKFGLEHENEILGKTDHDFFSNLHADAALKDERELLSGNIDTIFKEEREVYPNNEIKWVSTIKIPFKNDKEEIIGTCGISTDITKRKFAEEKIKSYMMELENLNKSKDRLYSIIAHDLKGPFNSLLGFTRLLKGGLEKLSEEEVKIALSSINKSAEAIYQLLENLLIFAKSQMHGITKPKLFKINGSISEVVHLMEEFAKEKNISIKNTIKLYLYVYSDVQMFETVVRNILHNAIKFTHRNGTIEISANRLDDYTEIIISDSGVGISSDEINKIFDMDLSISKHGTMNEKGTGLGLSLCKDLIEKNNGTITVESSEGTGSKFKIRLPN